MKDKILFLILGILIGAVITAGCFLVIGKSARKGMKDGDFRPNKEMFENFDEEMFENFDEDKMPKDFKPEKPEKSDNAEKTTSETSDQNEKTEE